MTIEILGDGCSKCKVLKRQVQQAIPLVEALELGTYPPFTYGRLMGAQQALAWLLSDKIKEPCLAFLCREDREKLQSALLPEADFCLESTVESTTVSRAT